MEMDIASRVILTSFGLLIDSIIIRQIINRS